MRRYREGLRRGALGHAGAAVLLMASASAAIAASSGWARTDVSQVRLVSATAAVGAREALRLGLQFQLDPGWKIYWRSPGDSGSPPVADFSASRNVASVDVAWPAPQRFSDFGIETIGYLDGTVLPLTVRPERPGEPVTVDAVVNYQACQKVCIPFTAELSLELPAGPAAATAFTQLIERYGALVPQAPEAAGIEIAAAGVTGTPPAQRLEVVARSAMPFAAPELFVEAPSRFRLPAGTARLAADGREARLVVPVEARGEGDLAGTDIVITLVDGARAAEFALTVAPLAGAPAAPAAGLPFLAVLGLALLGGLILNLMPCVLPVLSLKLMGVISHGGGERGRVRVSFLASAAGIVVSFLVLAAAAVAVKLAGGAVGWGIQFQQPLFLVFVVLVISLFAYNLAGLYEIVLPPWLGGVAASADARAEAAAGGLAGHFVTGAFATLLATPCSAPFLGTAVGFALARGPSEIFAVFAALGVGMAVPYLLVAAFPGAATRLPRPGPWMPWLRRVLALALAGTAVWLLSVLATVSGVVAAAALAVLVALVGIALWLIHARPARRRPALGALGVLVAPARPAADEGMVSAELDWRPFDEAAIGEAVARGQVVFVDVTAEWCVTCQVNKRLVFGSPEVRARLEAPGVLRMRADWTRPNERIAAYLASFGRYGIPFNAVYGPAAREGIVLPELLSRDQVLAALEQAGRAEARLAN
jgi:suppressor for copper-sensitivity B